MENNNNAIDNVINIADVLEEVAPEAVEMSIPKKRGFSWGKFAIGTLVVTTAVGCVVKGVQVIRAHKAKKAQEQDEGVDNVKVAEHDVIEEKTKK